MFLDWSEKLEIGDPMVDSEHRYLVQLINNLHQQYEVGRLSGSLAKVFTHLAKYVNGHFKNEEALMASIGYPELEEHKKQHRQLVEQAIELSEKYIDGEDSVTEETIAFLKDWAVNHITGSDMKIRAFLKGARPPELTDTPAFADPAGADFKKCTLCGKSWRTFDDLKNDDGKVVIGCQADLNNHLYNLILFNCSCDTTLAMILKEFVTQTDIPFIIGERTESEERPSYCLITKAGSPCLEKCACAYTEKILKALG